MVNSLGTLTWVVFALLATSLAITAVVWNKNQARVDRLALTLFTASFILGLCADIVSPIAALPVGIMVLCATLYSSPGNLKWFGLAGIVINALLVFTHKYPGFHNPVAISKMLVSPDGIPYTFSNKKVEIAVTKIIHGMPVANRGALRNPESFDFYEKIKEQLQE